jgi:CDP-glucose 4,6-dehydratase
MDLNPELWKGRRVLVTGHTGFKGSWLVFWLNKLGAEVIGLSLPPLESRSSLYINANIGSVLTSEYFTDIRNELGVEKAFLNSKPDYVFHLAAQALVSKSINNPRETITTNVVGTTNVLLSSMSLRSVLGVTLATTDKVYRNIIDHKPFKETDELGGLDPYSSSKAATELIVTSLISKFNSNKTPVTTVRAGNVIGGGDYGENRLVPDLFTALNLDQILMVRNLTSTRPWQYILDCLRGYLLIAQAHLQNKPNIPNSINFGPTSSLSVKEVINIFQLAFKKEVNYKVIESTFKETDKLELNSQLAFNYLGWRPLLTPQVAIMRTANWYLKSSARVNSQELMFEDISNYTKDSL